MRYRAEIDGLRAVAVIPVILFHAGFSLFSGGFVGVDVFFVISGYLITSIIVGELEKEKFSIVKFYERRARRILPALFLVMAVCVPFAWMLLTPADLDYFSRSLIAVALFSSNILFWQESGYFDTAAELKPLLHTWSLAVEEQYYLLFPLFLLLVWRFGKKHVGWALVFIFFVSLGLAQWASINYPEAAFFLLPTRAWEIMLGAFAALILADPERFKGKSYSDPLALLGLFCILASIFIYDETIPFPGLYALLPTVGAFLVILFAGPGTRVARILSFRKIVLVGLMSYSIYLWHQPVIVFYKYARLYEISLSERLLLLVPIFILSYVSWRYVEGPLRSGFKNKSVLFRYVLVFSLMVPAGFMLMRMDNSGGYVIDSGAEMKLRKEYVSTVCSSRNENALCPPPAGKKILIVGDSMWLDALNVIWMVRPTEYDVSQLGGCPPHTDLVSLMQNMRAESKKCRALNERRFRQDFDQYHGVVIISRYGRYRPDDLEPYLEYLKSKNVKNVMIFGSYYAVDFPMDRLMKRYGNQEVLLSNLSERHLKYGDVTDDKFSEIVKKYGASFVSLREGACQNGNCTYFFDGKPFTFDRHHLTLSFSKVVADANREKILNFLDKK